MESKAERFDVATASKVKFEPQEISLQDLGKWPGVRVEQWAGDSGDVPETVLPQHALAITLESEAYSEASWVGHSNIKGPLRPGELVFFPAGVPYSAKTRGYWKGILVGIDPAFLQAAVAPSGHRSIELLPQSGIADGFLYHAANALANDIKEGYPSGGLYGESISVAIAAYLARHYAARDVDGNGRDLRRQQQQQRLREFLLDQLHENISLADMAAFMAMDVYSFSRWFKSAFGVPPHRYLLEARITRAKELLARSSMTIVEIALRCGFYSQSHLATTFRRSVGVPPRTYRQSVHQ